jgi:hypothetical protein
MFVSIVYVLFPVSSLNTCSAAGHIIQKIKACHVGATEFIFLNYFSLICYQNMSGHVTIFMFLSTLHVCALIRIKNSLPSLNLMSLLVLINAISSLIV